MLGNAWLVNPETREGAWVGGTNRVCSLGPVAPTYSSHLSCHVIPACSSAYHSDLESFGARHIAGAAADSVSVGGRHL